MGSAQQPLLRHYTIRDGLPSNVVYDVYQDSKGFIWFCTDQGVSRFDGSEFRNYSTKDGLPDMEVFRIREDGQHRFWMICFNQKACYLLNDKIYNSKNDALCRRIEALGIRYDDMFQALNGRFCLVGKEIGMLCERPPYITIWPDRSTSEGRIGYFRQGNNEYIMSRTTVYDLTSGRKQFLSNSEIAESAYDGKYLYTFTGSGKSGLPSLDQWLVKPDMIAHLRSVPAPSIIHQMNPGSPGQLLCCTEDGLMIYHSATGRFERENTFPPHIRSNRMLKDREGNRWLSTLNDGVYFKAANNTTIINTQTGLARNNILSLLYTADGTLVAGDDKGNVNLIEADGIRSVAVTHTKANNRMLLLLDAAPGKLIVGGDEGVFALDRRTLDFRLVFTHAFKSAVKAGSVAFAGYVGGFVRINTATMEPVHFETKNRAAAIVMDRKGVLWMGGHNGLWYYKRGRLYDYRLHPVLNDSRVTCLALSPEGYVIAGTNSMGLFVVSDEQQAPLHLLQQDGLSSNNCKRLLTAGDGIVWLSSEEGLDRLVFASGIRPVIRPFPLPETVAGYRINDLQETNGKLLLATSEGIVMLDAHDTFFSKPPRLYLDAVNDSAFTDNRKDAVRLFSYRERNIQVSFIGVSFSGGKGLQYRYLLKGGSEDTLYTTSRSVNFSSLSPGKYEFLLWARSPGSAWTTKPVRLAFTILPPFWRHPLFLIASALLLIAAFVSGYRIRMKVIRKRAEKAAHNRQQLAGLEMKALRAQINPHFVFNALNSIQSYYSQHDELKANHYMTSFARFIRLTLLHSQSHWLSLAEELSMLRIYVELEQMRFKQLFTFGITFSPEFNQEEVVVPAMLIQPYVENAISHGLRSLKERKGMLTIRFVLEEAALLCEVEDNGIGRARAAAGRPPEHTSLGMKINRERIDTINRMYDIDIQLTIVDKPADEGTIIRLLIPLKKTN